MAVERPGTDGALRKGVLLVLQSTAVGGMEAHCRDLAHEYAGRGIKVNAIVPTGTQFDALATSFPRGGKSVVRLSTDSRNGRLMQLVHWLKLVLVMRRLAPSAVHLHTGGSTGGLAVALAARLASSATMVITEHDVPTPRRSGLRDRLGRGLLDSLCHAVIAVSRRQAAIRHQRLGGPKRKLLSVLNGVPVHDVSPLEVAENRESVRQQFSIQTDAILIGSVVRLDEGKGLDTLLDSFATVRGRLACELILVGDGPLRANLEAQASSLGVEDHVHFAGYQKDPARFFDALDLFVLAVPVGSMSIALLEAMARGVPSLITFGGPEEAVVDGVSGFTAPPSDSVGLAKVIEHVLEDKDLRLTVGKAGAEYVRTNFSVSRVADDLLTIYGAARTDTVPERYRALATSSSAMAKEGAGRG